MLFRVFSVLRAAPIPNRIQDSTKISQHYRHFRWRILYSMFFGYAVFYLTRKSFTFAMPEMLKTLPYTKEELGILISAFYLSYGVSKFISGMLSDRANPRYFMAIGLIITGILNLLFGASSSLWAFTIIWMLNGFFQGWGWPPCAKLLTYWYAQSERGRWWSVWNTSHNVGGALIPLIAAAAIAFGSWRTAMYVPGVIAIVMGFFLINRLRDIPASEGLPTVEEYRQEKIVQHADDAEVLATSQWKIFVRYVLRNPAIWLLAAAYVMVYFARTAVSDWGGYLTVQGYSIPTADACLAFFEIGGLLGSLVAGFASYLFFKGQRDPINVMYSVLLVFAILAFWLARTHLFVVSASLVFLMGFLVYGPQMLIGVAAVEFSDRRAAGTATGFLGLFGYICAALSGFPLGWVVQHCQWHGFFIVTLVCASVSVIFFAGLMGLSHTFSASKCTAFCSSLSRQLLL